MHSTWIITRARDESTSLVTALQARGVAGVALPCIERALLPWPRWPRGLSTRRHGLLFLTSLTAARCAHDAAEQWAPLLEAGRLSIAAASPRTDAWLSSHGHRVDIAAAHGAVGLARAVRQWQHGRADALPLDVLYPTSDTGQAQPEQAEALRLLGSLGTVARARVYQTRAPADLPELLGAVPPGPTRWLFASPSAVAHALAALKATRVPPALDVLCLGASTLRAWRAHRPEGWPNGTLHPPQAELADVIAQFEGARS